MTIFDFRLYQCFVKILYGTLCLSESVWWWWNNSLLLLRRCYCWQAESQQGSILVCSDKNNRVNDHTERKHISTLWLSTTLLPTVSPPHSFLVEIWQNAPHCPGDGGASHNAEAKHCLAGGIRLRAVCGHAGWAFEGDTARACSAGGIFPYICGGTAVTLEPRQAIWQAIWGVLAVTRCTGGLPVWLIKYYSLLDIDKQLLHQRN